MSTTDLSHGAAARPMTAEERRVIVASSLGTVFEWYDFYLYGSLAVMIGAQFFSAFDPATRNVFALLAFAVSAFSLPMLVDRRTDAVTAVVTSINAVLRNKRVMLLWAMIIAASVPVAIAIRTAVLKDGQAHVQAGAGIVADSNPEHEYEETCNKARAMMRAIELAEQGLE